MTYKSSMGDELCLTSQTDGTALITMTNGENRFRFSTLERWHSLLDQVLSDASVKSLLITGTGKYFSNGLDLDWLKSQSENILDKFLDDCTELMKRILLFPIPTVAVINGHAFAGGAILATVCDYRVMRKDRGWFSFPEALLGLMFPAPLLNIIRTKIPPGTAQREALIYAKRFTGDQARELQLVDMVTDQSQLMEAAKGLVKGALGKSGLTRNSLGEMKGDVYSNYVPCSKL